MSEHETRFLNLSPYTQREVLIPMAEKPEEPNNKLVINKSPYTKREVTVDISEDEKGKRNENYQSDRPLALTRRDVLKIAGLVGASIIVNSADDKIKKGKRAIFGDTQKQNINRPDNRDSHVSGSGSGAGIDKSTPTATSTDEPEPTSTPANEPEPTSTPANEPEPTSTPEYVEKLTNPNKRIGQISLEEDVTIVFPKEILEATYKTPGWVEKHLDPRYSSINSETGEVSMRLNLQSGGIATDDHEQIERFDSYNQHPDLTGVVTTDRKNTNFLLAHSGQQTSIAGLVTTDILPFYFFEEVFVQRGGNMNTLNDMEFKVQQIQNGIVVEEKVRFVDAKVYETRDLESAMRGVVGAVDTNNIDLDDLGVDVPETGNHLFFATTHDLNSSNRTKKLVIQTVLVKEPTVDTYGFANKEIDPGYELEAAFIINNSDNSRYGANINGRFSVLSSTTRAGMFYQSDAQHGAFLENASRITGGQNKTPDVIKGDGSDEYMRNLRKGSDGTTIMVVKDGGIVAFDNIALKSGLNNPSAELITEERFQRMQYQHVLAELYNSGYLAEVGINSPEKLMREITSGNLRAFMELVQQKYKKENGVGGNTYVFEVNGTKHNEFGLRDSAEAINKPFDALVQEVNLVTGKIYKTEDFLDPAKVKVMNNTYRRVRGKNIWESVGMHRTAYDNKGLLNPQNTLVINSK
ncbi:hypothetical protein IPM62_01475 [Candidatus Woesebacteria bacterium]|nr:MAG: hypothetical protein IPM62_01475 [Candidatus Woesebacteria bacterium]